LPELLRPDPPRSLGERLSSLLVAISPARAATSVGLLLLFAVTGWWLLRPSPPPVEASLPRAEGSSPPASPASSTPAATESPSEVVVQVAGAVLAPGVYHLAEGSRVVDLVQVAGGPAPEADLDAVALAARLVDGQRVQVPRRGEVLPDEVTGRAPPPAASPPSGVDASGPLTPVDLNTATAAELDELPGVGPATAQAIIAYRDRHGPFSSVDDLAEVRGIGPARLEALRDLVVV
jgi:competence protein ComEA